MRAEPKINIIGGHAYGTTGGIQAVNRLLVRELGAAGLLRRAFFLWDDPATVIAEGRRAREDGLASFYGLNRRAFLGDLLRQAIEHPRDVWVCTHVNYALLGLLASGWRPRRVAVILHAAELDETVSGLKGFALRQAGHVITVSEFTRKIAVRMGVRPGRVQVLHNGVDDPCPAWRPNPVPPVTSMVLFVGRMDERYKGQMELLDAMLLLRQRLPQLRLVFVGGGQTLEDWKFEASRRNLADIVEFRGKVSDEELQQAYAEAAVFAMPSENEGFGLVYAEAMAHGLPCIGGDRDAAREVITNGETGFCVPTGNSTALADAISGLLKSPENMARMGRAGRQRFLENFTTAQYRRRLLTMVGNWRQSLN